MSVSHPLLKQLKANILKIHESCEPREIRDNHPCLLPLCKTLESIFREGLKVSSNAGFGVTKRYYWAWIHEMILQRGKHHIPFSLSEAIECTNNNVKVFTNIGKGRLFIRTALSLKILQSLVECFFEDEIFVFSTYDPETSILGNEILTEIFSSLLHEIHKMDFKLELKNASFLDESWELGLYIKYEFVPCKEMGITFAYVKGRAVVVKVDEGSVAAEEGQIEIGDVLDELYGRSLYRSKRGLIPSLAHQYQGLPIYLTIVKCMGSNGVYPPLKSVLDKLGIRKQVEKKKEPEKAIENRESNSGTSTLKFDLLLLNKFILKKDARTTQIQMAINKAIDLNAEPKPIFIEIDETKLKIIEKDTEECVLSKHFTEISACGRKQSSPEIFAIIAGNTTCTIADEFLCYVVKTPSDAVAQSIMSSVAQGFGRTHWEV